MAIFWLAAMHKFLRMCKEFLDLWLSSMIWSRLMVAWGLFMVNSLGQYPVQGFFKQTIGESAVCFLQIAIPLMGCIVSAKRVSFLQIWVCTSDSKA